MSIFPILPTCLLSLLLPASFPGLGPAPEVGDATGSAWSVGPSDHVPGRGRSGSPGTPDSVRLRAVVDSFAKGGQFEGGVVLVAAGDRVLLAEGWGLADRAWGIENEPDTRFRLGSMTKAFTATLVMRLAQEGRLALSDPIGDHVPDLPSRVAEEITVRHLLTHTSGLPEFYRLDDFDRLWLYEPPPLEELIHWLVRHPLDFRPGDHFAYRNSGFLLLGHLVERVTGGSYEEALRIRVLEPAGMSDSGVEQSGEVVQRRAWGYARTGDGWRRGGGVDPDLLHAAGGVYSTARDLLRFSRALNSGRILDREHRDLMFRPQVKEDEDSEDPRSYALGWHVDRVSLESDRPPLTIVEHGGDVTSFETLLTLVPELDGVVIILFNHGETDQDAIRDALLRVLLRQPG